MAKETIWNGKHYASRADAARDNNHTEMYMYRWLKRGAKSDSEVEDILSYEKKRNGAIKADYDKGLNIYALSRKYYLAPSTIRCIVNEYGYYRKFKED